MYKKIGRTLVPLIAVTMAGCGMESSGPQSAVKDYVSALTHDNVKELNKVVYFGKAANEKTPEFTEEQGIVDGKIMGAGHRLRQALDKHGGLDRVKVLKVVSYGHDRKKVEFELVCKDGHVFKPHSSSDGIYVLKTSSGWKVDPAA